MSLKSALKSVYPLVYYSSRISFRLLRLTLFSIFLAFSFLFVVFYFYVLRGLPSPSSLATQPLPLTTHIRDRNGTELYKIYTNQNRTLAHLAELPPHVKQAVIAIEDKDFYHHRGFSPIGIVRALLKNLNRSQIACALSTEHCSLSLQGGSTITQQLVKTALLTPQRSLQRKLKELVLALSVESLFSKDEILEMYLNRVGFGGAVYGIEEAAQTYFGLSARDIDLSQAALLAGLPASPTTYSPFGAHPDLALSRQQQVLNQMVDQGFITWEQAETAAAENLNLRPPKSDIHAPHFVMYVRELLAQKYGSDAVEHGGLDVITTLDLPLQEKAQSVVSSEIAKISYLNIQNGAALVTAPGTGQILAMVGSKDYFDISHDGQVNVTLSLRQPGSAIKPVNYALAFSRNFTPASIISDSPITYHVPGQPDYSPVNYDKRFHGQVTLRTALASSYNVPAVKLLAANGVGEMVAMGQKMGISSWTDPARFGLSLTLGGGEVTILDMATAYGVLANSGNRTDLNPILSVHDSSGRLLEEHHAIPQPAIDSRIAFLISDILSDNRARTPTFGPRSLLYLPDSRVPVKTGTTNQLRDNWTIGYTPDFLVAVWVGNNDNSPMSYVASGITGASPIWRQITDYLLKDHPFTAYSPPDNIVKLALCGGNTEYFLSGTQPHAPCASVTPAPPSAGRILTGLVAPTPISPPRIDPQPQPQPPQDTPIVRKKPKKR